MEGDPVHELRRCAVRAQQRVDRDLAKAADARKRAAPRGNGSALPAQEEPFGGSQVRLVGSAPVVTRESAPGCQNILAQVTISSAALLP